MANEQHLWGLFNGESRETWHVTEGDARAKMVERVAHYEALARGSDFSGIPIPHYRVESRPAFGEASRLWADRRNARPRAPSPGGDPLELQADEGESRFDADDPRTFVLKNAKGARLAQMVVVDGAVRLLD